MLSLIRAAASDADDHLFLDVVPLLSSHNVPLCKGEILELCNTWSQGSSTIDGVPIKEGVCLRVEQATDGIYNVSKAVKHKGFVFCALEGIARNDENYVDTEEVA
jgi:hypothetical protein